MLQTQPLCVTLAFRTSNFLESFEISPTTCTVLVHMSRAYAAGHMHVPGYLHPTHARCGFVVITNLLGLGSIMSVVRRVQETIDACHLQRQGGTSIIRIHVLDADKITCVRSALFDFIFLGTPCGMTAPQRHSQSFSLTATNRTEAVRRCTVLLNEKFSSVVHVLTMMSTTHFTGHLKVKI